MTFAVGNDVIVAATKDQRVVVFSPWVDKPIREWPLPERKALWSSMTLLGGEVVLCSGTWVRFDLRTARALELPTPSGVVDAVMASRDGRWLAARTFVDGKLFLDTFERVGTTLRPRGHLRLDHWAASFLPDNNLVTCGLDGVLRAYEPGAQRLQWSLEGKLSASAVATADDGRQLALLHDDMLQLVKLPSRKLGALVGKGELWPTARPCFSPDGRLVFAGVRPRTKAPNIACWNTASGVRIELPFRHPKAVQALQCSPDGTMLVSSGSDSTMRWWDISSLA